MKPKTYTGGRAVLYAVPMFLTPFADELVPILREDAWPPLSRIVACSIVGVIVMCIGLRAFYDGSVQRARDAATTKNLSL